MKDDFFVIKFLAILQIVLIALKITIIIELSWLTVLIPSIIFLIGLITLVILILKDTWEEKNTQSERERVWQERIISYEDALKGYKLELEKNPNSTFYAGLVKNTEEYIDELKNELNEFKTKLNQ